MQHTLLPANSVCGAHAAQGTLFGARPYNGMPMVLVPHCSRTYSTTFMQSLRKELTTRGRRTVTAPVCGMQSAAKCRELYLQPIFASDNTPRTVAWLFCPTLCDCTHRSSSTRNPKAGSPAVCCRVRWLAQLPNSSCLPHTSVAPTAPCFGPLATSCSQPGNVLLRPDGVWCLAADRMA